MNMASMYVNLILILLLLAITVLYMMGRKVLGLQLKEKEKENEELKQELLGLMPGLNDGSALTCRINRKDMVMEFDKRMADLAGMPTHKWTLESFRCILNTDCTNVFEMWTTHYTHLHTPIERRLRFHITLDKGKTYHWWELIYKIDKRNAYDKWFNALFVNIDKVKDRENAIDDSQKKIYRVEMKEALLATINHDLRTPLNAVTGFATLLAEHYDDFSEEERKEFSQIVYSNSESMLKLTDIIKSMSENEIAERSYRTMPKSVSELLNFSFSTNRIICPSHLSFKLETPEGVEDKFINIDSMRIERVINNFISNAFKFTPVGEVTLGWKYLEKTKQVEIFVSDSGIGISEDNQKKIFEEYTKLNEHAHGTGLGLNICKKIVEKHGGEIGLTSAFGQGSTFYCRFKTIENV